MGAQELLDMYVEDALQMKLNFMQEHMNFVGAEYYSKEEKKLMKYLSRIIDAYERGAL